MKKKALALLLAAAMAIQPLSVAGAAEFTDGQSVDVEAETVEEVAEEPVEVFTDDAAEEPVVEKEKSEEGSVAPSETVVQMGDDVWAEFDEPNGLVTVSGSGAMWDYLEDGLTLDKQHENPFSKWSGIQKIVFEDEITHIGSFWLFRNSVNSVVFPKGLTSIGENSFYQCKNLSEVNLPEGLTNIGKSAFYGCRNLSQINLPESLTSIGRETFSDCSTLSQINFSEGLTSIGVGAFSHCRNLSQINLPESLTNIGDSAFSNCGNLSQINLPESLTNIGDSAFYGCTRLDNVCIPQGVSDLSYNVFGDCSFLSNVTLQEGLQRIAEGTFSNCIRLQEITIPQSVREILCGAYDIFEGCNNLKTIKGYTCSAAKKYYDSLPEEQKQRITFESIGEGTHQWSDEEVIIREATCEIQGEKAFKCSICGAFSDNKTIIPALGHNWSNWSTIKDPTETEVGKKQRTCWRCDKVEMQDIPKLSPIRFEYENVSWQNYDKLSISARVNKPVYFYVEYKKANEPEPKFDESKLDKSRELTKYISVSISSIPEEPVTIYLFVQDKDGNYTHTTLEPYYGNRPEKPATTIKVGDNITATIEGDTLTLTGSGATYDYDYGRSWYNADKSKITKIKFDGPIIYLGNYLFYDFDGIVDFKIPEGVTKVGNSILDGCESVQTIKFPSSLKIIPNLYCEWGWENVTSVEISEGIEGIDTRAFAEYSKLKEINLPSSIQYIGDGAFLGTGITKFSWPENITTISANVFNGTKLNEFAVPESVTDISDTVFMNCSNLKKITIPSTVKYIGDDVFNGCRNLTIYGDRDSVAERYAYINNIPFVSDCFKVIFKEDGRTKETEYVKKGENATPPTLAPRPGYTLSWDADYTNITEDMVINAVWTKNDSDKPEPPSGVYPPSETKYTVTFKDRGKVIKTEKVVSGEAADFPYVSRYGYELSWDKDFSKVTSNMTVNAVWTVIKPVKVTSMTAEVLPKYARLSWDETEFTSYYLVYRKAAADKEFKQVAKTTRVLWNDKKVKPGNEYQYKVAAVRSVEGKKYQGEYSDTVTVKIGKPEIGDVYSVGKLNYKVVNSSEVRVIGLAKVTGSVNIPNTVTISGKVYKVTAIDYKAFYRNENLVDVKIGNNVNYIGKYSFYQCPNLESVKFGGRVQTISTCAFTQCPKLGNIVLPSSLERLGAKAFFKCTSMRIMTVKTSRLNYLGTKAFAINPKITIRVPKSKYSAYVKMIKKSGRYAATKFQKF